MSSIFYTPVEKRYALYPRRWLVEYHVDGRRSNPTTKGSCATLTSARRNAVRACDQGFCTLVRIFDRRGGAYAYTYKASAAGVSRAEGYVR